MRHHRLQPGRTELRGAALGGDRMRFSHLLEAGVAVATLAACNETSTPFRCTGVAPCSSSDAGVDVVVDGGDDAGAGGQTGQGGAGGSGDCTGNSDCVASNGADPGVCLSNQGRRCATAGDVVYVQNTAACDELGTGTVDKPFCTLATALVRNSSFKRPAVLIRGTVASGGAQLQGRTNDPLLTIIGQQSARVVGSLLSALLLVDGGPVFIRDVTFGGSDGVGISAKNGATLTLDHVTVAQNSGGGILVDGAAFDITNTAITNNGPSSDLSWGGMRVQGSIGSPATLTNTSVLNNLAAGFSCTSAIAGSGVLATGNQAGDIAPACQVVACSPAGPSCGAQP
jgi:hypothetical protein